jgi:hypothetical protein
LDSGTAILVFPENKDMILLMHDNPGLDPDRWAGIDKPDECEGNYACICKCTELKVKRERVINNNDYHVWCKSGISCETFSYAINGKCFLEPTATVKMRGAEKWECKQGVYFGREVEINRNAHLFDGESPKERVLRIENIADTVYVCENPDPVNGCVPPLPAP